MKRPFLHRSRQKEKNHVLILVKGKTEKESGRIAKDIILAIHKMNRQNAEEKMSFEIYETVNRL